MFTFKQFTIDDSACAMKVGTDGVLLGAWAPVRNAGKILDVGTGSGLIALMLAQRNSLAEIDAIDIDGCAVRQAEQNAAASPFHKRIKLWETDYAVMQETEKYDLIVSNPPFYNEDIPCPDEKRDTARHTASLPFSELISKTSRLLSPDGIFAVIIPTVCVADFIGTCAMHRLYMCHRTDIHTTTRKPAKRTLLSFTASCDHNSTADRLYMRDETNSLSEEYRTLTRDFYLY